MQDISIYNSSGYSSIYNEEKFNRNDGVVVYLRDYVNYTYELVDMGGTATGHLNVQLGKYEVNLLAVYSSPSLCPF